ncbi:MAG: PD40 domain-containing protein [Phycisphaerae bacterium]|nr:PD40 domain-containing protein [Phycisphaerae bacterium]
MTRLSLIVPALIASSALAQPAAETTADWRSAEAPGLTGHVQLTFPDRFTRAGEAYFSPDSRWIIFQAIAVPDEGEEPSSIYAMYVARLKRDTQIDAIVGIEEPILVSPPGSANTCGFFHPSERGRIIFGSTLVPPAEKAPAGYQRGTSSYAWQFPSEMEVVTMIVPSIVYDGRPKVTEDIDWPEESLIPTPVWTRPGYDAECAYSPSGRYIVHTQVNPDTNDPDLFVYDTQKHEHKPLIVTRGYDGGPFFSPDGSMICYRSDRKGNDLLQVYIAELAFADDGSIIGVKREKPVTDNEHVNWAPFWHPSGEFLIYATSEQGHQNYEVYAIQPPIGLSSDVLPADLKKKRLTFAPGFDGLPVFSPQGEYMMWTSQRGPKLEHEQRPSSQLWIARVGDVEP